MPAPAPSGTPPLAAFLSVGDAHRLRDLLAFAMAVESGSGTVDALRRDADAALEAYAFRTLHNRVEDIRREAVNEQMSRLRPPPGFLKIVFANLVAIALLAAAALAAWRYDGPALLQILGI